VVFEALPGVGAPKLDEVRGEAAWRSEHHQLVAGRAVWCAARAHPLTGTAPCYPGHALAPHPWAGPVASGLCGCIDQAGLGPLFWPGRARMTSLQGRAAVVSLDPVC
jgi:hypothetical protein